MFQQNDNDCLESRLLRVIQQVNEVFQMFMMHNDDVFFYPFLRLQDDDLERQAAKIVLEIDNLFQLLMMNNVDGNYNSSIVQVRQVRVHAQDMVLLLCSRFIDKIAESHSRRISSDLKQRLDTAFGKDTLSDIDLWARLGDARHNIFMERIIFGQKKRQRKNRVKKEKQNPHSVDIGVDVITHPTDSPMFIRDLASMFSGVNM